RCKRKRLTLTPHYDPRVEEFVVNDVLSVFKHFEDERVKAEEEEKRRKKEEEKNKQEEKQKLLSVAVTPEDKGKAVEHDPLVLLLQEQLEIQKAEQEKIKEDVKNLTEGQEHVLKTQEDISSKLDAILTHISRQP
ncbi:hypothetical protein A2U01_0048887, partial [Trifolium medium]|nr:hypothetical protein [Trifolium medium]